MWEKKIIRRKNIFFPDLFPCLIVQKYFLLHTNPFFYSFLCSCLFLTFFFVSFLLFPHVHLSFLCCACFSLPPHVFSSHLSSSIFVYYLSSSFLHSLPPYILPLFSSIPLSFIVSYFSSPCLFPLLF